MSESVEPSTTFSHAAVPLTSFEHLLIGALPRMTIPPHKPLADSSLVRVPSSFCDEVKIIGLETVPSAIIFDPRLI